MKMLTIDEAKKRWLGPDPWKRWYAWRPVRLSELRGAHFYETRRWAWFRWVWRADACYPIYAEALSYKGSPIFMSKAFSLGDLNRERMLWFWKQTADAGHALSARNHNAVIK